MAQISKITLPDSATYGIRAGAIPFGEVDSTSTSTVFTATVEGVTELVDGVCCYLMNGVVTSASGWTLNVNNLGAKPVYQTLAAATETTTIFNINYTMLFVYNSQRVTDGCWDIFYGYNSNTTYSNASLGQGYGTCSTAEATTTKAVTLSSYALTTGGIVAVKFTNAVPASSKLNINSKGAKAIYYRGAAITAGIIKAGDVAYFIYNGTYYHLLGVDTIVSKTSQLTNDSGFLTTETDPTVPSWAKASSKPTYTASEVGALPNTTVIPSAGTTATAVSTTASGGSASTYSKSDHVHSLSFSTVTSALGFTPAGTSTATQSNDGLMSAADKTKLDGISPSGQIQANWNETDPSSSAYIQNKPEYVSSFINDAGYLNQTSLVVALEDDVTATIYYLLGTNSALTLGTGVQTVLNMYTSGKKAIFARVLSATEMRAYEPVYVNQSNGTLGMVAMDADYVYYITLTPDPSNPTTQMVGSETKISMDKYPVGSVYVTSTNTNPSSYLGGTWSLWDKEFDAAEETALVTRNSTNFSAATVYVSRDGHSMTFSGSVTANVAISNTNLEVLTQTMSNNGASAGVNTNNIVFVGQCDSAHALVLMDIDSAGRIRTLDVVVRGTGTSISSGSIITWNVTVPCQASDMVDSYCNKFYWRRTA